MGKSTTEMTPIERALAKVRALREAERKMTDPGWQYIPNTTLDIWTKDGPGYGIVANVAPWCPPYEGPALEQKRNDATGITALRNAAPEMLDLLEALLEQQKPDMESAIKALLDLHDDSEYCKANKRVKAALAAFVEGSDG